MSSEISEGSILGKHYKIEAFLGEGTFGVVAKCRNTKNNKTMAIKINKSKPEILQQAKLEMFILEKLRRLDADTCNIVKWNDVFLHEEHICLNFELLDQSLWDYIKDRNYKGLPIRELRPILHQLSNALYHIGSLGIVHADLKPGNIMVVNRHESPIKVKVIDFGLAHPVSTVIPGTNVQTIWYRAPEVMLHIPYNEAIDMWSLGLVAVELAIGVPLYPGKMNYDVLKFITDIQGQPPDYILDCGFATEYYFRKNNHSEQRWTFKTEEQFLYETGYQSKDTRCIRLQHLDDLKQVITVRTGPESGTDLLVSLIKRMLALDANQRIKPLEVLKHPFFDHGLSKSSSCIKMSSRGGQNLVVSQQPSNWKRERPDKINCSFQNSGKPAQQEHLNMSANKSFLQDDREISEGSILGKQYKIEAFLGEGTFGVVAKCRNTKNNKTMAIKINKSKPEILQQAKLEMFILEKLRCLDADTCNIVKWNDSFLHGERICLNFELLDQNLWDYIKDRNYKGLPIRELRPILHQLSNALYHIGSLGIVHADLKPGNIMVVNRHESPIKVKVIDFGLAHPVSAVIPGTCVQTIWYRAPEVMLHIPYNEAIDMWSLGLVAVELATGVPLYPGKMDYDVLKFITHTQGQPPDYILDCGFGTEYYFRKNNHREQRWTFKTEEQFLYETGYQSKDTRHIRLQHLDDLKQVITVRTGPESGTDLLVSLIKQMLALDANQRIKPLEVLKHPFFDPGLSKSSPCVKMSSRGGQNFVVSQQPSNGKRERPDKIHCSFKNSGELAQQEHFNVSANESLQDDREISEGSIIGKYFKVEAFLGEGTFGVVAKCRNIKNNKTVAIKINRSKPEILQQAKLELRILKKLQSLDADTCNFVKWNDSFLHGERICLNFELLDQNLWDYLKDRNYKGLPIRELRSILHQLSNALYHLGSLEILHADLKPGNIMVVNRHESPVKVKVIDFGLAHPVSEVIPGACVQTIWYRAPEVMLHIPYNEAIDMWSLGLVAVELAIGVPLYPGKMDYDVLNFIINTQGQPPDYILDCGMATEYYFRKNDHSEQRWTFKTEEQFLYETGYQSKDTRCIRLQHLDDLKQVITVRTGPESGTDLLVSLIKQMLALDANQRIKPLEVLKHPFFDPGLSKSSPCVKMSSRGGQNLVVSQQPSNGKKERPDKIHCSFKNSGELAQQEHFNVSANESLQDDREISEGSIIGKYFKVEAFLGEGTFGVVAKCRNIKNNKTVAIKINRSKPEILQQAKLELRILKKLQSLDADTCNFVKWNDSFLHGERICLNFELLDQNLWDYLKDRNYKGLPIRELRSILHQLSNALYHLGSLEILHADLKPGNIMVVNRHESPVKVKVIDFGLAHPVSEVIPGACVQTIWYRAPEVMLHIPYNEAIDMWSLGLVAVELAIGVPLYPGKMDYDVLNFIINTQGQPPDYILDCGFATEYYFRKNDHSEQRWTFKTEEQFLYETGYQSKDTRCIRLQHLDDLKQVITVRTGPESGTDLLVSLIKQMLALDANQRIKPLEVLKHPFFDPGLRVSQALK